MNYCTSHTHQIGVQKVPSSKVKCSNDLTCLKIPNFHIFIDIVCSVKVAAVTKCHLRFTDHQGMTCSLRFKGYSKIKRIHHDCFWADYLIDPMGLAYAGNLARAGYRLWMFKIFYKHTPSLHLYANKWGFDDDYSVLNIRPWLWLLLQQSYKMKIIIIKASNWIESINIE